MIIRHNAFEEGAIRPEGDHPETQRKAGEMDFMEFIRFLDMHSDLSTEVIQRLRDQHDRFMTLKAEGLDF